MLWMQTYLFYCTVRLGVIVIALLTLLQQLVPAVLLLAYGIEILEPFVELFRNDDYYNKNILIKKFLNWIDEHPQNFIILINIVLFLHIVNCLLAICGAFKLLKFLLLPFIVIEFIRVNVCLTGHIILMIVLKKLINLGVLVAFTLLGGFLILYLAYNWCTCVALYQIISLINCKRYRALYGDDPFSPQLFINNSKHSNYQYSFNTIDNVHVLTTPDGNEVDAIKQKNYEQQQKALQRQGIIAVLPVNYQQQQQQQQPRIPITFGDSTRFKQRTRKWWQDTKTKSNAMAISTVAAATTATATQAQSTYQQQHQQQFQQQQLKQNFNNDYTVNYDHWQWSEIFVPGAKKRNVLLGANF